jgi:hypothetical protein
MSLFGKDASAMPKDFVSRHQLEVIEPYSDTSRGSCAHAIFRVNTGAEFFTPYEHFISAAMATAVNSFFGS